MAHTRFQLTVHHILPIYLLNAQEKLPLILFKGYLKKRYEIKYVDTISGEDYWPSLRGINEEPSPKDLWPSFYGCFDWHSSVHNHWCLVKLLKTYPNIPEAKQIRERLNESFDPANIKRETEFLEANEFGLFEFPIRTILAA